EDAEQHERDRRLSPPHHLEHVPDLVIPALLLLLLLRRRGARRRGVLLRHDGQQPTGPRTPDRLRGQRLRRPLPGPARPQSDGPRPHATSTAPAPDAPAATTCPAPAAPADRKSGCAPGCRSRWPPGAPHR